MQINYTLKFIDQVDLQKTPASFQRALGHDPTALRKMISDHGGSPDADQSRTAVFFSVLSKKKLDNKDKAKLGAAVEVQHKKMTSAMEKQLPVYRAKEALTALLSGGTVAKEGVGGIVNTAADYLRGAIRARNTKIAVVCAADMFKAVSDHLNTVQKGKLRRIDASPEFRGLNLHEESFREVCFLGKWWRCSTVGLVHIRRMLRQLFARVNRGAADRESLGRLWRTFLFITASDVETTLSLLGVCNTDSTSVPRPVVPSEHNITLKLQKWCYATAHHRRATLWDPMEAARMICRTLGLAAGDGRRLSPVAVTEMLAFCPKKTLTYVVDFLRRGGYAALDVVQSWRLGLLPAIRQRLHLRS